MKARARHVLLGTFLGLVPLLAVGSTFGKSTEMYPRQRHACVFDKQVLRTAPGTCRPRALAYPKRVVGDVKRSIYDAALTFGVPYPVLLRIAKCESGLNPRADAGQYKGLFQFLPDTFRRGASNMVGMTGIKAHNVWSPADSSYVAGFLFAIGKAPSWSCEPPI